MKKLLLTAALGLAMATGAMAESKSELSAPIVMCLQFIGPNADKLGLDDAQKAELKRFMTEEVPGVAAYDKEVTAMRADLRGMIHMGGDKDARMALAEKIGAAETKRLMMRSNCADHWRGVLSKEQFAEVLAMAKKAMGGM